ncbi:PREDICTED: uncharacterized protein At3g28850-like [Camelina sativa]|uniref:Uncharacterized protein At3g28850-like n=1 Tax=Camelina sativa TaxID=90675 RepID=A0ABM0YEQ4_CAMSA|nr:PREDICTED: uncharacterized protein At3g28850-like [Camelina sativa]
MGGCVSSNFLNPTDENFSSQINASTLSHHFVKLTSTTYGLLNLDSSSPSLPPPPSSSATSAISPMTPPERFTIDGKETMVGKSEPTTTEVISFWELMSGLDGGDTCRFSPIPAKCNVSDGGGRVMMVNKENSDPNLKNPRDSESDYEVLKPLDPKLAEEAERLCDGGEDRVVIYTTSLRGVRRTFEACNAVRAAIESFGVVVCEKDVSMDRGFREELSNLMARERRDNGGGGDDSSTAAVVVLPPRVFVKGKYIGGAEEVMSLVEEGLLGDLLRGIPRKKDRCGGGCGGLAFLPCSECNGSCKVVEGWGSEAVVVKCMECNENGLVRCPICS